MTGPDSAFSPCTCFHLRRAARLVTQAYDRELAPSGLSLNQYSILRRSRHQPRPLGDLADELGMDRSTLSRNIGPLLDSKLLTETRGEDARQRLIEISSDGRERLKLAQPLWQRAQQRIHAEFGEDNTQRLHRQLQALAAAITGASA